MAWRATLCMNYNTRCCRFHFKGPLNAICDSTNLQILMGGVYSRQAALYPLATAQGCTSHAISCRYGWLTAGKGTPHCLCCAGICGSWSLSGPKPVCKWGTPDSPARLPHWPLWTPPDWPCSSCFCFFVRCRTSSLFPWSPRGLLEAPAAY